MSLTIEANRPVLRRVAKTIARYNMFKPGATAGVAVSGGADSLCLLYVLRELAPRWNLRLHVLHLDHKLRADASRADAAFVTAVAGRLGYPLHLREVDVRGVAATEKDNMEQAARKARRVFFRELIAGGAVDVVATGHTRSDQAETVLFRLLRGTGQTGLAGIRPVTSDGLVRPLIEIEREEARTYLRERGLEWREDSTNLDVSLARNRIRQELLPALARDWNPSVEAVLAQVAELARDDEEFLDAEVERLASCHLVVGPGHVDIDVRSIAGLAPGIKRRLLRHAIQLIRGDLRQVSHDHVRRLMALAEPHAGAGRLLVAGIEACRSLDSIRFAPRKDLRSDPSFCLSIEAPCSLRVPGTRMFVEIQQAIVDSSYTGSESDLDCERLGRSLYLRNWRPGDRYCPMGSEAPKRLKILFQEQRIPLWERRKWPIITDGETILWARRFGIAEGFGVTAATRAVMRIRVREEAAREA